MDKARFDQWYQGEWLPLARDLTNQIAVLSRHLGKQKKAPSKESMDALSGKFADIRENMVTVNEQMIALESRTL